LIFNTEQASEQHLPQGSSLKVEWDQDRKNSTSETSL